MTTTQEVAAAEAFLAAKLREFVAQSHVPALACVLVRDAGATIVSGQQGIRKVGASGPQNDIQPGDRFNIGSISKVFAAHLIGVMIDAGTPGLSWGSTLMEIMPGLASIPNPYMQVTVDQYTTHVSGMPYTPNEQRESTQEWETTGPGQWNNAGRIALKLTYVKNALMDPPEQGAWPPGTKEIYGGGQVINASMLEHITGTSFEDLMQQHVFGPLNMTNSSFGRTAWNGDDGPWFHGWDAASLKVVAQAQWLYPGFDDAPRNPVGGMCCNAADMGKFLAESVRPDPQLFNPKTLQSMQTFLPYPPPVSNFTRGAWGTNNWGTSDANIAYEGDIGVALAQIAVYLNSKVAVGAMSNVQNTFSGAAINDASEAALAMNTNWQLLFAAGAPPAVECVHAMPALTSTGSHFTLFARLHTGEVIRRSSTDSGQTWSDPITFPGWIMTSGLAAGCSSDGQKAYVFGRGTDNQIWWGKTTDGTNWQGSWAVPFGTFMTGPAVTVSGDGNVIHLLAVGMDRRMYHIQSGDGGQHWSDVQPIGQGVFTSAPAAAARFDGGNLHVFGRGDDYRIWTNTLAAGQWQPHWTPIGQGIFTSGPGATTEFDGSTVHVMGRGTDRQLWHNSSDSFGGPWQPHWNQMSQYGTFDSAPSLAHGGGPDLYVAALGGDFNVWLNHSSSSGQTWENAWPVGPNAGFFI